MQRSYKSKSEFGSNEKNVYLSMPFEGNVRGEIITKLLTYADKNTFYADTIRIHFTFSALLRLRLKDKVCDSTASF